jgi:hypothetical protein
MRIFKLLNMKQSSIISALTPLGCRLWSKLKVKIKHQAVNTYWYANIKHNGTLQLQMETTGPYFVASRTTVPWVMASLITLLPFRISLILATAAVTVPLAYPLA